MEDQHSIDPNENKIIEITQKDLDELPADSNEITITEDEIRQAAVDYLSTNPNLNFINDDIGVEDQRRFYDKLRDSILSWSQGQGKISKYIEYILIAPDIFLLLYRLTIDSRVSQNLHKKLMFVLFYFISPIDPMPEATLGPIGYLDDVVVTALVILKALNELDEDIIRKHWSGKGDIVPVLKNIAGVGEILVGSKLWASLKKKIGIK